MIKKFFVWLLRPVVKEILKENMPTTTTNISIPSVSVSANDPRVDELVKTMHELFGMGNLESVVARRD